MRHRNISQLNINNRPSRFKFIIEKFNSFDKKGRSFLAEKDFSRAELEYLIGLSAHLKDLKKRNIQHHYLAGKNIALLFEKTSTRTRAAFTTAAIDLGAHPEYLGANDIQLGKKESTEDTAKVLGRMLIRRIVRVCIGWYI